MGRDLPRLFYLGKLNQSPDLRWLRVCRVDNLDCVAHHRRRSHGLGRGSLLSVLSYWFRTGGRAAACPDLLSLPSPTTF
jgi:hypothetical protein